MDGHRDSGVKEQCILRPEKTVVNTLSNLPFNPFASFICKLAFVTLYKSCQIGKFMTALDFL